MNYYKINKYSISNGPGVRVEIFFCGCNFHCKNCFNSHLWDFKSGKLFNEEAKTLLFFYLNDKNIKGISILGGEPLEQGEELLNLLQEIKMKFPNKNIWLWTGYTMTEIQKDKLKNKIILNCDFIVDGRFEEDKKDINLLYRGSSNQCIYQKINEHFIVSDKYNKSI